MNNSIDAHLDFSFKGETYSFSSTLDLDRLLENGDALPALHPLLAAQHGIDTYSYLYEVMLEEPIRFDNARGMAADFVNGEDFDAAAYTAAWRNHRLLAPLQEIAKSEMGIDDLDRHPQLKNALMQAYHLGLRRNS